MPSDKPILFICSWYPNDNKPFLGNFVKRHAEALLTTGAKVHCFHINKDSHNKFFRKTVTTTGNLTETIIYIPYKPGVLGLFRTIKDRLAAIHELIGHYRYAEIVHMHALRDLAMEVWWTQLWSKPKPFFITEHSTWFLTQPFQKPNFLVWNAIKTLTAKATKILPVSQHLGKAMQAIALKGDYSVLENVVDVHLYENEKQPHPQFTFIHISTLIPAHKNPNGMMNAFKLALDTNPDLKFTIVSDEDYTLTQNYCASIGITENVTFIGPCSDMEVAAQLQSSDALVLFSNYENFPCVIAESWACGIPVISTKVGGIHEHLSIDKGILIDVGNEMALAEAMIQVSKNHNSYDTLAIKQYAEKHFSYESVGQKMRNLYDGLE